MNRPKIYFISLLILASVSFHSNAMQESHDEWEYEWQDDYSLNNTNETMEHAHNLTFFLGMVNIGQFGYHLANAVFHAQLNPALLVADAMGMAVAAYYYIKLRRRNPQRVSIV